jgi:hypothetical protein
MPIGWGPNLWWPEGQPNQKTYLQGLEDGRRQVFEKIKEFGLVLVVEEKYAALRDELQTVRAAQEGKP